MTLRISIIHQGDLHSKADGIAAYLRSFIRYAEGVHITYWGRCSWGHHDICGKEVVCHEIGHIDAKGRHIPRRVSFLLDLWLHRHAIWDASDVLFVQSSELVIPLVDAHGPPIVLVMHGWNPVVIASMYGWMRYLWLRMSDWIAVKSAAKTILVSREGFLGFSRRHQSTSHKFVYIPTFVDDSILTAPTPLIARQLLAMSGGPILLCVSRLAPEKQVDQAIRLLAAVKIHLADAVLIVVGDGPQRPYLERIAISLGVADSVWFQGEIEHEHISTYYAAADFFLLLSRWEGSSIALLEALVLGIPVVTTDIADHRTWITDQKRGLIVTSDHPVEEAASWICQRWKLAPRVSSFSDQCFHQYLASNIVPTVIEELQSVVRS